LAAWLVAGSAWAATEGKLEAGGVNPGYHEQPAWFKQSFLDLRDDVGEAAAADKRLLLYFYQDGCSYCQKLLDDNFGQQAIADKARERFDVVAINLWGDREVVDLTGRATTEKQFAADMRVMYTPTLLFLDGNGRQVLRLNGYYQPHKFSVALDYASGDSALSYADFMAAAAPRAASGALRDQSFFMRPPLLLARNRIAAERPLLVLFEQRECGSCDEFHDDVLARPATLELLAQFDVAQLDRFADTPLARPDGRKTTARAWAQELGVQYAPTLLFFDREGTEVFRAEAYLKSFHIQSVLDYVASGAYREQPHLQRYIQERADRLRAQGVAVDLME
jgi:thioredoxin-related protein